jgi:hypothetical protein
MNAPERNSTDWSGCASLMLIAMSHLLEQGRLSGLLRDQPGKTGPVEPSIRPSNLNECYKGLAFLRTFCYFDKCIQESHEEAGRYLPPLSNSEQEATRYHRMKKEAVADHFYRNSRRCTRKENI